MKTRLVIWVTSECNLHCPDCSQRHTMLVHRGYQMQMSEVCEIVKSCKDRHLHFDMIEITGGEPSLWINLEEGVKEFAKICGHVTLVTNGNNPERILDLNLKYWGVSATQATDYQMLMYQVAGNRVFYNSHPHKKMPVTSHEDSLPAKCCVAFTPGMEPQNNIMYLKGYVYYCCNAFALSKWTRHEEGTRIDFESDFMSYFKNKEYNKKICSFCLCNQNIYNKL